MFFVKRTQLATLPRAQHIQMRMCYNKKQTLLDALQKWANASGKSLKLVSSASSGAAASALGGGGGGAAEEPTPAPAAAFDFEALVGTKGDAVGVAH